MEGDLLKVNISSIRRTRRVCPVSEAVSPSFSLLSVSWLIWHRGWLCKALRARQDDSLTLQRASALKVCDAMRPGRAFILFGFVCVCAEISGDYSQERTGRRSSFKRCSGSLCLIRRFQFENGLKQSQLQVQPCNCEKCLQTTCQLPSKLGKLKHTSFAWLCNLSWFSAD